MLEAEEKLRKAGHLQTDSELQQFRNQMSTVDNLEQFIGVCVYETAVTK